jgi:ankyrin repeat protein
MDADIEIRKDKGDTAVHCAAFGGHDDVLQVLKTLRCFSLAVNTVDNAGASPLHKAAHRGWDSTVRLLVVELGAEVNKAMDKDHRTALHLACFQGHTETVRSLVTTCGANVESTTTAGATALHYAAMGGHSEVVAVLLDECSADIMARMNGGRTALHLAAAKQFYPVVRVLMAFLLNPKDVSTW